MANCPFDVCVPLDASPGYSAEKHLFKISHRTTERQPRRHAAGIPRDGSDPGADSKASTDRRISGRE
jgi:hypothetical protein